MYARGRQGKLGKEYIGKDKNCKAMCDNYYYYELFSTAILWPMVSLYLWATVVMMDLLVVPT